MKFFVHLTTAVGMLVLSSCSMTWVQQPPVDTSDGSRIITTAYQRHYRGNSIRIDRTAPDGSRSSHTIESLPGDFVDYSLSADSGESVTIRLLGPANKVIDVVEIPYSSFTSGGR